MKFNLKKVIASVAALAMSLSCFTAFAADFSDVEATASYKNAIDTLVGLEIVNGYEDGTFKPEAEITRAEVTKMVVAAMGPSYTAAAESSVGASEFVDVTGHWAAGYISVGVAQKFINGMGDGTFAPDANVTYAQIVKMLVAALGYTSAAEIAGGYPNGYLQTANQIGITEGVKGVAADTNVTRAQVAQLIANALDTPLVVVTNWTTNILTGEPVAETKIMNGEEGRAYKTLLTEYHNAYVVKGRVENTKATDPTMKAGTVEFSIEYTDNYETAEISVKDGDSAYPVDAFYGATNAEDLLFTYAEAIIKVNEDDEATIVCIAPYGKNEIVEVAAADFFSDSYAASGNLNLTELQFDKEGTSRKDKYPIASTVKMYVNGALVADGGASTPSYITDTNEVDSYIIANEIGTVTLINSPAAGSTSLDKEFDVIMVTMPKWAVVEETISSGDINKIIFGDFEDANVGSYINMDTTDEEAVYTFVKNGEEIAFEDIKAGDVALLTYDFVGYNARTASAIAFELCDTVVEGQVTGKSSDGKYTVNGEQYELLTGLSDLKVGAQYSLKLDAAGRVIDVTNLASAINYGIIDRVAYSSNDDAYTARIIKADGTRESVAIKKQVTIDGTAAKTAKDLFNKAYVASTDGTQTGGAATLGTDALIKTATNDLAALTARVITYKINSSKELSEVNFIGGTSTGSVEYKESTNKLGSSYKINEGTAIIDATSVTSAVANVGLGNYTASQIKAGSLSTFVDGESYTAVVADKVDGIYQFAVVLVGNASISLETSFAVVDSVDEAIDEADGEVKKTITVLDANSQGELVTYFIDEAVTGDVIGTPARGTVVALGLKDNVVVAYEKLFGGFANVADLTFSDLATIFSGLGAGNDIFDNSTPYTSDAFFRASGTAWDTTFAADAKGYARVGFGMIVDKKDSEVTFATGTTADAGYATNGVEIDIATGLKSFDLAADVNVYVVDNNFLNEKGTDRIAVGSTGSVMKTATVKEVTVWDTWGDDPADDAQDVHDIVAYGTSTDVISIENVPNGEANYAYFKVVDGDITDIVVFVPASN